MPRDKENMCVCSIVGFYFSKGSLKPNRRSSKASKDIMLKLNNSWIPYSLEKDSDYAESNQISNTTK